MFWGFSEALDLHAEYVASAETTSAKPRLNFLLCGSGDPRHIIKSAARSHLHAAEMSFFVVEGCPALIARHMLLASVAFESAEALSVRRKTDLFMDLYGNTLLRPSSAGYLASKAKHLVKCVTDLEFNAEMQSPFDLTHLRYAERDGLESTLSFWRQSDNRFDISGQWRRRVAKHLGQRYDSRHGAFDWDLQMRLKENGASQICPQEYRHWRDTGVAFLAPEHRQTTPNRTMAVQLRDWSFPGDIEVGPYAAFGLTCDDPSLLKAHYGRNEYRATDVCERNLFHLLHEIERRRPCPKDLFKPHKLGSATIDTASSASKGDNSEDDELTACAGALMNLEKRIKVIYLSPQDLRPTLNGHKFPHFFDLVFVGRDYFPLLASEFIAALAKPVSVILFETAQHSVLRREQTSETLAKVKRFASELNFKSVSRFNVNLPLRVAKYKFAESESE